MSNELSTRALSVSGEWQALSHVAPVRNYFLREDNYAAIRRAPGDQMFILVQRFGELIRKLWNPRNFKAHVSPHEMLQAVVRCSSKKFQITEQGRSVGRCIHLLASAAGCLYVCVYVYITLYLSDSF